MPQKLILTPLIEKFVNETDNPTTAVQYGRRLNNFDQFLRSRYNINIDEFAASFKVNPKYDVYEVTSEYRLSLRGKIQQNTIATRMMTCRHFLEINDVPITNIKWKRKVRPPKIEQPDKKALTKEDVRKIILGCQLPRLRTFVQAVASSGWRSSEVLSVLTKHIDLENGTMHVRKEYTKMRKARTTLLTKECINQFKQWIEYRNRVRRFVTGGKKEGKRNITYKTVPLKPDTLFFSTGRFDASNDNPTDLYKIVYRDFVNMMKTIGLTTRREVDHRAEITLHRLRDYVKTTISNLGYQDFSEYFIGHKHSTYWNSSPQEILDIFHKIEPYLTYLDYSELEAHGADTETKLSNNEQEMAAMREQMKTQQEQLKEMQEQMKRLALNPIFTPVEELSRHAGMTQDEYMKKFTEIVAAKLKDKEEKS
jgi:integrase